MRLRMHVRKVYVSRGAQEWNKWKNHFYEMKGGVGMSLHEK